MLNISGLQSRSITDETPSKGTFEIFEVEDLGLLFSLYRGEFVFVSDAIAVDPLIQSYLITSSVANIGECNLVYVLRERINRAGY